MCPVHGPSTIKSLINFQNAQKCAFLIMVCFSLYHGILMITKPGGNLCKSLLSDGSAGPAGEWRPYGCMTHMYSTSDSKRCMKQLATWGDPTRLYFIGDSRLLTLFNAFFRHLSGSHLPSKHTLNQDSTANVITLGSDILTMCFFRHHELSSSIISLIDNWNEIQKGIPPGSNKDSKRITNGTRKLFKSAPATASVCQSIPPTHLVISLGTKTIERSNHSVLLDYQRGLEDLAATLSSIKFTRTVWMLQDPVAEGLLSGERKVITNKDIDAYNNVAQKIMRNVPGVEIWRSNRLIAQRMGFPAVSWRCPVEPESTASSSVNLKTPVKNISTGTDGSTFSQHCINPPPLSDGFHVSDEAMARNVQVLLNLYCNDHMKFEDGTCCRSPEPITPIQTRCFAFICLCLLASFICFVYDTVLRSRTNLCVRIKRCISEHWSLGLHSNSLPDRTPDSANLSDPTHTTMFEDFYELVRCLSKFGLILMYFFICDRTILFMKTNKGFTIMSFLVPLTYFLILGLFFSGPTKETRLNHVDITREWKGWMQVYFLIYHFTGSYRVVPLFSFTRYLISAYLFLSGFGHFHYFWHRSLPESTLCKLLPVCFSLVELRATCHAWWLMIHRYLTVMFRMNFFVLALCLVMDRDYLFYYFMPLVSFWFTVIFTLMIVFPRVNSPVVTESTSTRSTTSAAAATTALRMHVVSEANPRSTNRAEPFSTTGMDSVHSHSSMCLKTLGTPPSVPTSAHYIKVQSASSTPRQTHRYDSSTSMMDCDLVRQSHGFIACTSSGGSSIDVRGHHKARSVGALSDVRQLMGLVDLSENAPLIRSKLQSSKKSLSWSEGWMHRFRSLSHPRTANQWVARFRYCLCSHLRLADILIGIKLAGLVIGIEVLNQSPRLFHALFFSGPQRRLFELTSAAPNPMEPYGDEAVSEHSFWYRRWSLDRYSVVYGMVFALICDWARRAGWLNDTTLCDLGLIAPPNELPSSGSQSFTEQNRLIHNISLKDSDSTPLNGTPADPSHFLNHISPSRRTGYNMFARLTCHRFTAFSLTVLGIFGIGGSMLVAFRCDDRVFCAKTHTFLCLIPILSYILVRNCLTVLRRVHSILFAWLGDITLELFIAQHHIWLSADGNGILVLLPGYPLLNLALTSFVFVCVCHEVHQLTHRLQRFLVPAGALQAVRNLLLLGVILHGIMHSSWHWSG